MAAVKKKAKKEEAITPANSPAPLLVKYRPDRYREENPIECPVDQVPPEHLPSALRALLERFAGEDDEFCDSYEELNAWKKLPIEERVTSAENWEQMTSVVEELGKLQKLAREKMECMAAPMRKLLQVAADPKLAELQKSQPFDEPLKVFLGKLSTQREEQDYSSYPYKKRKVPTGARSWSELKQGCTDDELAQSLSKGLEHLRYGAREIKGWEFSTNPWAISRSIEHSSSVDTILKGKEAFIREVRRVMKVPVGKLPAPEPEKPKDKPVEKKSSSKKAKEKDKPAPAAATPATKKPGKAPSGKMTWKQWSGMIRKLTGGAVDLSNLSAEDLAWWEGQYDANKKPGEAKEAWDKLEGGGSTAAVDPDPDGDDDGGGEPEPPKKKPAKKKGKDKPADPEDDLRNPPIEDAGDVGISPEDLEASVSPNLHPPDPDKVPVGFQSKIGRVIAKHGKDWACVLATKTQDRTCYRLQEVFPAEEWGLGTRDYQTLKGLYSKQAPKDRPLGCLLVEDPDGEKWVFNDEEATLRIQVVHTPKDLPAGPLDEEGIETCLQCLDARPAFGRKAEIIEADFGRDVVEELVETGLFGLNGEIYEVTLEGRNWLKARKNPAAPAASPVDADAGDPNDYRPSHPWYYKLGGKPVPVEEIDPPAGDDIGELQKLPKDPAKRRAKIEEVLRNAEDGFEEDARIYEDLVKRGVEALSEYDRRQQIIPGTASPLESTLAAKYNHIWYQKTRIKAARKMLAAMGDALQKVTAENWRQTCPAVAAIVDNWETASLGIFGTPAEKGNRLMKVERRGYHFVLYLQRDDHKWHIALNQDGTPHGSGGDWRAIGNEGDCETLWTMPKEAKKAVKALPKPAPAPAQDEEGESEAGPKTIARARLGMGDLELILACANGHLRGSKGGTGYVSRVIRLDGAEYCALEDDDSGDITLLPLVEQGAWRGSRRKYNDFDDHGDGPYAGLLVSVPGGQRVIGSIKSAMVVEMEQATEAATAAAGGVA